jgi:hypothetical protein
VNALAHRISNSLNYEEKWKQSVIDFLNQHFTQDFKNFLNDFSLNPLSFNPETLVSLIEQQPVDALGQFYQRFIEPCLVFSEPKEKDMGSFLGLFGRNLHVVDLKNPEKTIVYGQVPIFFGPHIKVQKNTPKKYYLASVFPPLDSEYNFLGENIPNHRNVENEETKNDHHHETLPSAQDTIEQDPFISFMNDFELFGKEKDTVYQAFNTIKSIQDILSRIFSGSHNDLFKETIAFFDKKNRTNKFDIFLKGLSEGSAFEKDMCHSLIKEQSIWVLKDFHDQVMRPRYENLNFDKDIQKETKNDPQELIEIIKEKNPENDSSDQDIGINSDEVQNSDNNRKSTISNPYSKDNPPFVILRDNDSRLERAAQQKALLKILSQEPHGLRQAFVEFSFKFQPKKSNRAQLFSGKTESMRNLPGNLFQYMKTNFDELKKDISSEEEDINDALTFLISGLKKDKVWSETEDKFVEGNGPLKLRKKRQKLMEQFKKEKPCAAFAFFHILVKAIAQKEDPAEQSYLLYSFGISESLRDILTLFAPRRETI